MQDCKTQILTSISDDTYCSRAFAIGVLSFAHISDNEILISAKSEVIQKFVKIVLNICPDLEVNSWANFLMLKGDIKTVLNKLDNQNLNFENDKEKLTFIKTLFVLSGRFYYNLDNNKNSKGYRLEFIIKQENIAEIVINILTELGFNLRKVKRTSYFSIFSKNSNTICDLLVSLGASYTALEMQNNLAIREMRNNINRQNNCFESNLDKTINASSIQIEAINYILEHYSIDYLSENLREVALVRIANPEVSLNDLKKLLNNNISRAGIKYRLDKIIEIYKKLKGEN